MYRSLSRLWVISGCLLIGLATAFKFGLGGAEAAPAAVTWPSIRLAQFATGLLQPVTITNAGDSSRRLFVVEQGGTIRVIKNGAVLGTPFLTVSDRIATNGGERGLLGLAFPPGYGVSKNHFYIYYTNTNGDLVTARYSVSANPDVANHDPEQVILTVPHPVNPNHNGGQLAFGPDGYLYLGPGDGGSGGDPPNNAQNTNLLLGKILRIDVETGSPLTYTIPTTNPFYNQPGKRGEIWADGLRNPWRFSFDRGNGDLYIGDVGQNCFEEIDVQPGNSLGGQNYGWRQMEGFHNYDTANPSNCNQPTPTPPGLTLPKTEIAHSPACAVIGGYVYRGARFFRLKGIYLYSDECSQQVWGLKNEGGWQTQLLAAAPFTVATFGEDEAGEVYLSDYFGGRILQVVSDSFFFLPAIFR